MSVFWALTAAVAAGWPFLARRRLEFRVRILELLAAAVRRELPLGEALATHAVELRGRGGRVVRRLVAGLARGYPLSRALAIASSKDFPPHVTAALAAAEGGPGLAGALAAASRESIEASSIAHQAWLSTVYPLFLLASVSGVFQIQKALVATNVFGMLDPSYAIPVPPALQAGIEAGAVGYGIFLASLFAIDLLFLYNFSFGRVPQIAACVSRLSIRLPLFGEADRLRSADRLCRALAPLVAAGWPLGRALDSVASAPGHAAVESSVRRAAAEIDLGTPAPDALSTLLLPGFVRTRAAAASGSTPERFAAALVALAEECAARRRERAARLVFMIYPTSALVAGAVIVFQYRAALLLSQGIGRSYGLW